MAVFDLTPAFNGLTKTISIERESGYYEKGIWTQTGNQTSTAKAVIQPMGKGEINNIQIEGLYTSDFIKIYSDTAFNSTGVGNVGDFITIDGTRYVVREIKDWQHLGNYSRAICERVE
jgi:hypothetical protein